MYEPTGNKLPREAERQLVLNAVGQDTGIRALRVHSMRVVPATERPRDLDVPELASFDVIAMFKDPANPEWPEVDAENAAIAIMDTRRRL